jgi:hypothetical protein
LRAGVPVYCTFTPVDVTLEDFVIVVASLKDAIGRMSAKRRADKTFSSLLIDPDEAARSVVRATEEANLILSGRSSLSDVAASHALQNGVRIIRDAFRGLADVDRSS